MGRDRQCIYGRSGSPKRVLTDAYHAAEGVGQSVELSKLYLIGRFGVKAVLWRDTLGFGEMKRMNEAERVYNAKRANANAENWAEWAKKNPEEAELLARVEKMVDE